MIFSRNAQGLGDMASTESELIRGLGASPKRGPGAEPMVRGQGRSRLKLHESFEAFAHIKKAQKAVQSGCLPIFQPSGGECSFQGRKASPFAHTCGLPCPKPKICMTVRLTQGHRQYHRFIKRVKPWFHVKVNYFKEF